MLILLDSNQAIDRKNGEDTRRILEESGATLIVQPLECGDLAFKGKGEIKPWVGIELKTFPDLIASLRDGRLMTQLPAMTEEYDLSYLIYFGEEIRVSEDGDIYERKKGGWVTGPWRFHHLNSILARFEVSGGHVRHARDLSHAIATVCSLHDYWSKGDHSSEVFTKKRYKLVDWRQLDNKLAEMYERMGIGIKRAVALAEAYPTVEGLVNATELEIMNVPVQTKKTVQRMGRGNAKKIMKVLHG